MKKKFLSIVSLILAAAMLMPAAAYATETDTAVAAEGASLVILNGEERAENIKLFTYSTTKGTVDLDVPEGYDVIWMSSDDDVATVDPATGVVTAKAEELKTATITAINKSDATDSAECVIEVTPRACTRVEISGDTIDTEYVSGQSFDATGMTVKAKYNDAEDLVTVTDYQIKVNGEANRPLKASDNAITVVVDGIPSAALDITVTERTVSAVKVLYPKTSYTEGDKIKDLEVEVSFNDGDKIIMTSGFEISITEALKTTDTSYYVTYQNVKSDAVSIKVAAKTGSETTTPDGSGNSGSIPATGNVIIYEGTIPTEYEVGDKVDFSKVTKFTLYKDGVAQSTSSSNIKSALEKKNTAFTSSQIGDNTTVTFTVTVSGTSGSVAYTLKLTGLKVVEAANAHVYFIHGRNDTVIATYDDIEDALDATVEQDKNVDTDDFDLDSDVTSSRPITLKLGEDAELDDTYEYDPEYPVIIDLNGYTLTLYSSTVDLSKANDGNLTITNSSSTPVKVIYDDLDVTVTVEKNEDLVFEYDADVVPGLYVVEVTAGKNGTVTSKPDMDKSGKIEAGEGTEIIFTITPAKSYQLDVIKADGKTVDASEYSESTSGVIIYKYKVDDDGGEVEITFKECEHPNGYSVLVKTVAPTCTESGYDLYECSLCSATQKTNLTSPHGHNLLFIERVPSSCETEAYILTKCLLCEEEVRRYTGKALGHDYGEWSVTTEPGFDTEGQKERSCSRCEKTETVTLHPLNASHTYTLTVVPATCTEKGYVIYACTGCDHEYTDKYTVALGHVMVNATRTPTCVSEGYEGMVCDVCGYLETTSTTPALGHNFVVISTVEAVSCVSAGYDNLECTRCKELTVGNIVTVPHTATAWVIDEPATETYEGSMHMDCAVCFSTYDRRPVPRLIPTKESGYTVESQLLKDVASQTSPEDLAAAFMPALGEVKVYSANGTEIADAMYIGTGCEVRLVQDGIIFDRLTVIITGDINGDGLVDQADADILAYYYAGWTGYEEQIVHPAAADMDGNRIMTRKDAMILTRNLHGWSLE